MTTTAPRHRRTLAAVLVLVAALVAAACSESDATLDRSDGETTTTEADEPTTTSAGDTSSTTAPDGPAVAPIQWRSCGSAECATYEVPLDYDDPTGETIQLSVRRLPATGDRIGSLFLNFGGPGAGAADLIDAFPIPSAVLERFDIVGMDPRGVGSSTPLACGLDPETLYRVDPTIEDDIDAKNLIDISEEYAADCAADRGDLLPHVGTRNVARDMDQIRAAMGDEQLSYVGYSYGTSIGQAYADLFPGRVRAMILDGVVDPAPTGIEVATQQALGFETALANWAAGCAARNCGLADPIADVETMLDLAEAGLPSSGGLRALGPGEAATGLAYPLYNQSLWPSLDAAIADALDRDGTGMVRLADGYIELADFSIYFAVSCLDSTWPRSTDQFLADAKAAGAVAPHFGEAIVNDYIRCAVWPTDPDPIGAISAPDAPSILVVSTTGDPATPYENGVVVADRLAKGVLLTFEGEGHTVTFQGVRCVDDIATDYLVDGTVPADGARC